VACACGKAGDGAACQYGAVGAMHPGKGGQSSATPCTRLKDVMNLQSGCWVEEGGGRGGRGGGGLSFQGDNWL